MCVAVFGAVSQRNCKRCVTYSKHRDPSPQGGCCTTGGMASGKESFLFIEFQQLFLYEGCWVPFVPQTLLILVT